MTSSTRYCETVDTPGCPALVDRMLDAGCSREDVEARIDELGTAIKDLEAGQDVARLDAARNC